MLPDTQGEVPIGTGRGREGEGGRRGEGRDAKKSMSDQLGRGHRTNSFFVCLLALAVHLNKIMLLDCFCQLKK